MKPPDNRRQFLRGGLMMVRQRLANPQEFSQRCGKRSLLDAAFTHHIMQQGNTDIPDL